VIFDGIKEYDEKTKADILEHYAPNREPDEHGSHLVWAFHFMRDQALFFPHFKKTAEHRLAVDLPPARRLHDATMDILKAIDTYKLPYFAAFRYRAKERLPLIKSPALFLKTRGELEAVLKQINEMAALTENSVIESCAKAPESTAQVMASFIQQVEH
jgi:hypothetical protein